MLLLSIKVSFDFVFTIKLKGNDFNEECLVNLIELSKMLLEASKKFTLEEIASTLSRAVDLIFSPYWDVNIKLDEEMAPKKSNIIDD